MAISILYTRPNASVPFFDSSVVGYIDFSAAIVECTTFAPVISNDALTCQGDLVVRDGKDADWEAAKTQYAATISALADARTRDGVTRQVTVD